LETKEIVQLQSFIQKSKLHPMTTKETSADNLAQNDAKYLALIDEHLGEIKTIHRNVARKRAEGQKIGARIDRNLKQIQAIINRVEATL